MHVSLTENDLLQELRLPMRLKMKMGLAVGMHSSSIVWRSFWDSNRRCTNAALQLGGFGQSVLPAQACARFSLQHTWQAYAVMQQ